MQTKIILASAGRMYMKKFLISLGLLAFVLAGCAPSVTQEDSKELNIYSARHYDIDKAIIASFEAETGIKVNVIAGNEIGRASCWESV